MPPGLCFAFTVTAGCRGVSPKKLRTLLPQRDCFRFARNSPHGCAIRNGLEHKSQAGRESKSLYCPGGAGGRLLLSDRWDYWFVKCYLGLYLFAPVLNAFAERVPRSAFRLFLVSFFLFQTVYGWLMPSGAAYIEQGYSAFSFMGLYLLARYVRLHSGALWQRNRRFDLTVYLLFVLLNTLCAFATARLGVPLGTALCFAYTNPFIILASLHFLLFFSKISFRSRLVNEVSVSCFAIYLVHSNAFLADPCYDDLILGWFRTLSTIPFLGHVVLLMAAVFVASILFDRVRILLWQPLSRKLPIPDAYR